MRGIRVDLDELAGYARQIRAAGEDVAATADREVHVAPESFGELGRGAAASYERLRAALLERRDRAAESLTEAGDGLRSVVDFHADEDTADLRGQEA